jgi:cytochrome c-type biogenesis protein CcmF
MWQSLPQFGTAVIYAILVTAAYTFAVALAAGRGRPRLLQSARLGAYATSSLVFLGVMLLAYAFITHDFRIRYVAHYSSRTMTTGFLLTSLWGGQDGSILWWLALMSLYIVACVRWLKGRYRELQPYVIATLMVIVSFFAILMLFAANPFATSIAGARVDGEGLNPLLQNYWMIIHPPSLYTGFVGCSIPFSFAIAAMVSGRLDNEWINATRKWMLFAFIFLTIGNCLGMVWAYEELGWGGYWAWDPVENAACLPWFTATAFLHSTMIQERRNMLKVWNVVLICVTFFLTIFGTFLTRSGLIASVHAFAQSDIGIFFVYFMGLIVAVSAGLLIWRWPLLRNKSEAQIEAVASREAMFLVNNWALVGGMTFILIATTFPKISQWLYHQKITVGPPFFNRWMAPIGLAIFILMGLAPLFGWRKTSKGALKKAVIAPLIALFVFGGLHLAFGKAVGLPAVVQNDRFYPGFIGTVLQKLGSILPLLVVSFAGFNLAVIAQEFARGIRARRSAAQRRGEHEGVMTALVRLLDKNRRRYGGYIVHVGVVLLFLGFTGRAWGKDAEASLMPGDRYQIGEYTLTYQGVRMEVDKTKRMIFTDLDVSRNGKPDGKVSPAKFIYIQPPQPTTEVSMKHSFRDDLYTVLGNVNPTTKRATFQFHVNPLVSWIWFGVMIMVTGAAISLWPELAFREVGVWAYVRGAAGVATGVLLAIWLAMSPTTALHHHWARAGPAPPALHANMARCTLPVGRLKGPGLASALGLALGLGLVASFGQRKKARSRSRDDLKR